MFNLKFSKLIALSLIMTVFLLQVESFATEIGQGISTIAESVENQISETVENLVDYLSDNVDLVQTFEEGEILLSSDDQLEAEKDLQIDFSGNESELSDEPSTISNLTSTSTSSSTNAVWNNMLAEQLGEDYLVPNKNNDVLNVTGHTNRLQYKATDLTLPGKNGLNLNIYRSFDNQDYDNTYYKISSDGSYYRTTNWTLYRFNYVYNTHDTYTYIGFTNTDEFDYFLKNGITISEMPSSVTSRQGNSFRTFQDIYRKKSDTGITLTYDPTVEPISNTTRDEERFDLEGSKIKPRTTYIGNGWSFDLPYISYVSTSYEKERTGTTIDVTRTYNGALMDIDGNMHDFYGTVYVTTVNGSLTQFRNYITSYTNDGFEYTLYAQNQTTIHNINYNIKVEDTYNQRTYYYYCSGLVYGALPKGKIVEIDDAYNNYISYNKDETTGITTITDTYGRNVYISSNGITYTDTETGNQHTIQYTKTTEPATTLANDSPFAERPVYRLTVTDELGRATIFDSRVVKSYATYSSSNLFQTTVPGSSDYEIVSSNEEGYNLERITYPTGYQTNIEYTPIYVSSSSTYTCHMMYGVSRKYDTTNSVISNDVNYTFDSSTRIVTINENRPIDNKKIARFYNTDYLLESEISTISTSTIQLEHATYSYNKTYHKVTTSNHYIGNMRIYNNNSYDSYGRVSSTYNGRERVNYTYHSGTNIPSSEAHYDGNTLKYTVKTTLTDNNASIEEQYTEKNSVQTAKIRFTYDSTGQIINRRIWTKDTNNDGILDDNDEYSDTSLAYGLTSNLSNITTETSSDIYDADNVPCNNIVQTLTTNSLGQTTNMVSGLGNQYSISYDNLNRPTQYTWPNGSSKTITYDDLNNQSTITEANGSQTKYTYNEKNKLIAVQKYDGTQWQPVKNISYDLLDRKIQQIEYSSVGNGFKTTYAYDVLNRPTSISVYDLSDNLKKNETYTYSSNASSQTTQKLITSPDNANLTQTIVQNAYGEITSETNASGSTSYVKSYSFDYKGNCIQSINELGNASNYTYDENGNLLTSTDPSNNTITNTYDLAGRKISVTDANGSTKTIEYDIIGRIIRTYSPVTSSLSSLTKTYYDGDSNVVKTAIQSNDANSATSFNIKEFAYDNMSNLTSTKENDGARDIFTLYTYDNIGRPVSTYTGLSSIATSPSNPLITYHYDSLGNVDQITDALNHTETMTYDYLGNVLTKVDRNGTTIESNYDMFGLSQLSYYEPGEEDPTEEVYYERDSLGRLINNYSTSYGDVTSTITKTYDAFGRITSEVSDGFTKNYSYDALGNTTNFSMNFGNRNLITESYTYNNCNQMISQTNGNDSINYSYDANGNLTTKTYGDFASNYTYDLSNELIELENTFNGNQYNDFVYTYALDGNILNETDGSNTKQYSYDKTGKLISETVNGSTTSYSYDLKGNRSSKTENGTTTNYSYDLNNRLINETTVGSNIIYSYDNNGNRTIKLAPDDTSSYYYNLKGQLYGVNNNNGYTYYDYNAAGLIKNRMSNSDTSWLIWNGDKLVCDYTLNNGVKTYSHGVDGVLFQKFNSNITYYLKNSHGNIVSECSTDGTIVATNTFDAYGNTNLSSNGFGYCGEYQDVETNLTYLRARFYDQTTGTFISEDPVKDGLNWYSYCNGNPVSYYDPTGTTIKIDLKKTDENYNSDTLLNDLQALTNDSLYIENDCVKIENKADDNGIKLKNGTQLIRYLVGSSAKLNLQPNKDVSKYNTSGLMENQTANCTITIPEQPQKNAISVIDPQTNYVSWEVSPNYVSLAHELCHAYNAFDHGASTNSNVQYAYLLNNHTYQIENATEYELEASGINYTKLYDNRYSWNIFDKNTISENSIRYEHGLNLRNRYNSLQE